MQIMGELANHQASTPPPFPTPTRPASSLDQPERGPHELRPGNAVQNPQRPAGSGLPWSPLRGGAEGLAELRER